MRKNNALLYGAVGLAILGLSAIAAWWLIVGRVDRMIYDIKNARNSEEERAAFKTIDRRAGIQISFEPFDRAGKMVEISVDRWWEAVVRIRITINGRKVDHTIIDPENIGVLMHE